MFEKKIRNFFNSVTVCGELPTKEKMDKRLLTAIEITAGIASVMIGAVIALCLMDKFGNEEPDDENE